MVLTTGCPAPTERRGRTALAWYVPTVNLRCRLWGCAGDAPTVLELDGNLPPVGNSYCLAAVGRSRSRREAHRAGGGQLRISTRHPARQSPQRCDANGGD